jgi:predicted aspartyl protease
MISRQIVVFLAAVAAVGEARAVENPYAQLPSSATPFERFMRDAALGEPGAEAALSRWLKTHPDAEKAEKQQGWARLCKIYGLRTLYKLAAPACAAAKANGGDDDSGIAASLIHLPPVRAKGSARVPLVWNSLGSQNATVTVNTIALPWLVDTGAEISVVSKSNAEKIGVRPAKGSFEVGSTTASVNGQIGVIGRMRIGDATVENVPVLVLPDAQLSVGGGAMIQAILGIQVLQAFHRVAWLNDGTVLALGETAPKVKDQSYRLSWREGGLGIPLATKVAVMGAHLDTGSNSTFLWTAGESLLTADERAQAVKKTAHVGGAGGVISEEEEHYPALTFDIAGAQIRLTDVAVSPAKADGAGRVGMDVVGRLETMVLDFDHMALTATASRQPPRTHEVAFKP